MFIFYGFLGENYAMVPNGWIPVNSIIYPFALNTSAALIICAGLNTCANRYIK